MRALHMFVYAFYGPNQKERETRGKDRDRQQALTHNTHTQTHTDTHINKGRELENLRKRLAVYVMCARFVRARTKNAMSAAC